MTSYYEHAGITIYHGDCREILPQLPKADFLFADPPYGVDFKYGQYNDERVEYGELITQWFSSFNATCIAVTCGISNTCLWPQPRWILAWLKTNCMGASGLSGPKTVSRNQWEPILWYGKYPPLQCGTDTINAPIALMKEIDHPCPKPLSLMKKILSFSVLPDSITIDAFCGSGTTLLAAKDLGRCAIGIEIEERYCEISARRLSQEVLPLTA